MVAIPGPPRQLVCDNHYTTMHHAEYAEFLTLFIFVRSNSRTSPTAKMTHGIQSALIYSSIFFQLPRLRRRHADVAGAGARRRWRQATVGAGDAGGRGAEGGVDSG